MHRPFRQRVDAHLMRPGGTENERAHIGIPSGILWQCVMWQHKTQKLTRTGKDKFASLPPQSPHSDAKCSPQRRVLTLSQIET